MFTLDQVVPWGAPSTSTSSCSRLTPADLEAGSSAAATAGGLQRRGPRRGAVSSRAIPCMRSAASTSRRGSARPATPSWSRPAATPTSSSGTASRRSRSGGVRMRAMRVFLEDYDAGKEAGRYVEASLPVCRSRTAASISRCARTCCSSTAPSSTKRSTAPRSASCAASRPRSALPLLALDGSRSPFVDAASVRDRGFAVTISSWPQFQRGANAMLRFRTATSTKYISRWRSRRSRRRTRTASASRGPACRTSRWPRSCCSSNATSRVAASTPSRAPRTTSLTRARFEPLRALQLLDGSKAHAAHTAPTPASSADDNLVFAAVRRERACRCAWTSSCSRLFLSAYPPGHRDQRYAEWPAVHGLLPPLGETVARSCSASQLSRRRGRAASGRGCRRPCGSPTSGPRSRRLPRGRLYVHFQIYAPPTPVRPGPRRLDRGLGRVADRGGAADAGPWSEGQAVADACAPAPLRYRLTWLDRLRARWAAAPGRDPLASQPTLGAANVPPSIWPPWLVGRASWRRFAVTAVRSRPAQRSDARARDRPRPLQLLSFLVLTPARRRRDRRHVGLLPRRRRRGGQGPGRREADTRHCPRRLDEWAAPIALLPRDEPRGTPGGPCSR